MSKKPRPFLRMIIAGIFFLAAVTLNVLLPRYWQNIPEIVKHLLLVFSAIMCVHLMEYAYLWWEIFGHMRDILEDTLQATHRLIDGNRNALEKSLQTFNQLIGKAARCGLINLYCSRKDVKDDLYDTVENAEKRVWFLGVTLSENIHLDELLPTLDEKMSNGVDIKILLLDALQNTAIYRTLLESNASDAANIIMADRTKTQSTDPFFHQRLYSDFIHACNRFQIYPNVGTTVRFYTYTPSGWMIIADNTAYFQPYTFGRGVSEHSANLCIGDNMPVLKFQIQPSGQTFEILEDHFLKIWRTSNTDMFHIEARIADRNRIIKETFNSYSAWFKHVYEVLYVLNNNEPFATRYKFPRQCWQWNQPSLSICLQDSNTITGVTICDYSRDGLLLMLEGTQNLNVGQIVILQGTSPAEPLEANFIINHFLKTKNFVIRRIVNGPQPIIGLQAIPESEKSDDLNQIVGVSTDFNQSS